MFNNFSGALPHTSLQKQVVETHRHSGKHNRIHAIVRGDRDITADTDLRLCKFFGLSEGCFLRLQNAYDTMEAKRKIAAQVARIKPYRDADNRLGA